MIEEQFYEPCRSFVLMLLLDRLSRSISLRLHHRSRKGIKHFFMSIKEENEMKWNEMNKIHLNVAAAAVVVVCALTTLKLWYSWWTRTTQTERNKKLKWFCSGRRRKPAFSCRDEMFIDFWSREYLVDTVWQRQGEMEK